MSILTNTPTPGQICYDRWVSSTPDLDNLWHVKDQNSKATWEAAAAAALAAQWRPMSEPMSSESGKCLVSFGHCYGIYSPGDRAGTNALHWMPIPPLPTPPEPTPQGRERAEFDEWFRNAYLPVETNVATMWATWKAARRTKTPC